MAEADPEELVLVISAEDSATATIEGVKGSVGGLEASGADLGTGFGRGSAKGASSLRAVGSAAGATARILRATGNEGAAAFVSMSAAGLRFIPILGRMTAGATGLKLAMLGGPLGLAALGGGLAIGALAGAAAAGAFSPKSEAPKAVSVEVNVDARGTATEHRALADQIAREVEASVGSRARFPGTD